MTQINKATLYRRLSAGVMTSVALSVLQLTGLVLLTAMKSSLLLKPVAGIRRDCLERHGLIVSAEAVLAFN